MLKPLVKAVFPFILVATETAPPVSEIAARRFATLVKNS